MAWGGDYEHYRQTYTDKSTSLSMLAATDDQTSFLAAKSANHTVYVQRILTNVTTYSAKTWTFQDTAATPVIVGFFSIPAAAVALASESNTIVLDYGPAGFPLTKGKDLTLNVSGAGVAAIVRVEAYERLTGPVAMASTN